MDSVTLAVAYVGGLLTLFSPCSALLIPSFFSYAFSSKAKLASRTLVFFLGLMAGLLPTGAVFGALGAVLNSHLRSLTFWAGLVIIVLGLWQVFALPVPNFGRVKTWWKLRQARKSEASVAAGSSSRGVNSPGASVDASGSVSGRDRTSPVAIFLLGLTYGVATTGCQAPILGSILAFSVTGGSPVMGFFTMMAFGLGMFTPVVILSFLWNSIPSNWLRPRPLQILGRPTTVGSLVSGLIIVLLGLIMVVAGSGRLATSLLSASSQSQLEFAVQQALSGVPNWLFALLLGLIVAFVVVYFWGRRAPAKSKEPHRDK